MRSRCLIAAASSPGKAEVGAEFEQASGHKLSVELLDNDYPGGDRPADVYMSGPVLVREQLGLGFVRPLDEFTGRAQPTFDLGEPPNA